jgi:CBS-domain-containing membrane protein
MSGQTARDVMDPNPTVLAATDTVGTGIGYIMEKRFRNVPILDAEGCYLGVFGVNCLLRLVLPQAALMERGLTDLSFVSDSLKDLRRRLRESADQPVTICLSDEATVIAPDTPLLETLLVLYQTRRSIPVVDPKDRRLLGVVSYWDVGRAILAQEI